MVGLVILVVSVALAPSAWADFVDILRARGPGDASSFVPIPYIVRAVAGLALAIVAGRLEPRIGEPLLVVAIVVALPTLWFTALSTLVALVPLLWAGGTRRTAAIAPRRDGSTRSSHLTLGTHPPRSGRCPSSR